MRCKNSMQTLYSGRNRLFKIRIFDGLQPRDVKSHDRSRDLTTQNNGGVFVFRRITGKCKIPSFVPMRLKTQISMDTLNICVHFISTCKSVNTFNAQWQLNLWRFPDFVLVFSVGVHIIWGSNWGLISDYFIYFSYNKQTGQDTITTIIFLYNN